VEEEWVMEIQYVIGDATQPLGRGARLIVHGCNDQGYWGAGFTGALSRRWPQPERAYRTWARSTSGLPFALGQVTFVAVVPDLWVANLISQHGIRRAGGAPPIRYPAVRAGLVRVARFAQEHRASVHMPRLGCGLAGGAWPVIAAVIADELLAQRIPVTVYDQAPEGIVHARR
jgi:O-acetyl-ADP-ribose deacetylase (regulator of RNase III)